VETLAKLAASLKRGLDWSVLKTYTKATGKLPKNFFVGLNRGRLNVKLRR
jgi:hypothetical protein